MRPPESLFIRQCGACGGHGEVAIAGELRQTLSLLHAIGESSGADLARRAGITNEAMCNRLAKLVEYGKVTWKEAGDKRKKLYKVKPRKTNQNRGKK